MALFQEALHLSICLQYLNKEVHNIKSNLQSLKNLQKLAIYRKKSTKKENNT